MIREKKLSKNLLKYEITFENISPLDFELFNIFIIESSVGSIEEVDSKFFFYLREDKRDFLEEIFNFLKEKNINFKIRLVKELDDSYLYEWEKYLSPVIIENFLIKPSWFQLNTIEIDTPCAFGTGKHPTTQMCIEFILNLIKNEKFNSFLDAGTGSGILSIIAYKTKKIKKIIAFDKDIEAIKTAKNNFMKNRCNNIYLICSTFEGLKIKKYDLVCANMLSSIILDYKEILENLTKKYLIVSGIEENEKEKFLSNFQVKDLKLLNEKRKENWYSFLFKKL